MPERVSLSYEAGSYAPTSHLSAFRSNPMCTEAWRVSRRRYLVRATYDAGSFRCFRDKTISSSSKSATGEITPRLYQETVWSLELWPLEHRPQRPLIERETG